jgi:pimeloyl-ACP methyl ester carboxylesterase
VELAYFEWRRELRGREAPILMVHATGFHARVWDQVIRHLGERHVISVDQRGHGRSQKTEITHWKAFGRDLAAFVREFQDGREVYLAEHTHFLPMEAPELVARYVLEHFSEAGTANRRYWKA